MIPDPGFGVTETGTGTPTVAATHPLRVGGLARASWLSAASSVCDILARFIHTTHDAPEPQERVTDRRGQILRNKSSEVCQSRGKAISHLNNEQRVFVTSQFYFASL